MDTLTPRNLEFFRQHGYVTLPDLLSLKETTSFLKLFDDDREHHRYRWHQYGHHQSANYDALVTTPAFDRVVRHPLILETIVELMGGPVCFGEIGARYMGPYEGEGVHQGWHRDRPQAQDHPLRMDYIQLMVYLTDVDESTHCFSISPEAIADPLIQDNPAQLERGGCHDIHGPAGTVCLFNVSVLHTATTRPTQADRKTLQIYYGHLGGAPLANDSVIPAAFWKDHPDADVRAMYGNLNEVTRLYARAFGINDDAGSHIAQEK
jgi:hypothetical protein